MTPPTPRQLECLNFIRSYMAKNGGVSPSLSEIRDALGLAPTSKARACEILDGLEARGYIRRVKGFKRNIELVEPDAIRLSPDICEALAEYRKRTNCSLQTAANELLREYLGKVAA